MTWPTWRTDYATTPGLADRLAFTGGPAVIPPPPTIPPPISAVAGDWMPIRHVTNWRVVRCPGPKAVYHRGTDGSVRVYGGLEAAQARANKLNEK